MDHAKKHLSIAKDTSTNTRLVQYVLTWILDEHRSFIEIFDKHTTSALFGFEVSLSAFWHTSLYHWQKSKNALYWNMKKKWGHK